LFAVSGAMTPETADKSPCCLGRRAGRAAAERDCGFPLLAAADGGC
jgi:hypothetical protein